MNTELLWYTSGSGRIEFQMTLEQAQNATHSGPCDAGVLALSRVPEIKLQLDAIDSKVLATELKECGAWDAMELTDHAQNIQRILWIACGDIPEENRQ